MAVQQQFFDGFWRKIVAWTRDCPLLIQKTATPALEAGVRNP